MMLEEIFIKGLRWHQKKFDQIRDLKNYYQIYIKDVEHYWEMLNHEGEELICQSNQYGKKSIQVSDLKGKELLLISENHTQNVYQSIFGYFWQNFLRNRRLGFAMIIILLFYGLSYLGEPIFLNLVMGHLYFFNRPTDWGILFLCGGMGMIIVSKIEYFLQKFSVFYLGNLAMHLSKDFLQTYLIQEAAFLNQKTSDEIYTRLYASEQVFFRILQQFFNLINDGLFFLINFILMFIFSWQLSCLEILFLSLQAGVQLIYLKRYFQQSKKVLELQQNYLSYLMELFKNLMSLKAYSKEWIFWNRWQEEIASYWQSFLKNDFFQQKVLVLNDFLKKLNALMILALVIALIHQHQINEASFLIFLFLKTQVYLRFDGIFKRLMQWQYLKSPIIRMQDLIDTNPLTPVVYSGEHIQIKDLMYLPGKSLSKTFLQGRKYFIKGASGCGKTSMLNSILGIKKVSRGEVVLPHGIAVIMQNDQAWQGNILENICFFEKNINYNTLSNAISMVDLKLPLNSKIKNLSAGEQQRVLLARALYTQPKCLILDEATCHLDEESELKIVSRLLGLPITILMISHNPRLASLFDECFELH
jgi:ATP-binding cassette, subfamily B, bacterial CvaB/MchF/RaxB